MKKAQIIFLASIVVISGCVGQGTGGGPSGPGCTITGPTLNPSTADPGTTILMDVIVENKGGAECKDVRVELIGFPSQISVSERSKDLGSLLPADPSRGLKEGQQGVAQFTLTGTGRTVDVPYDIGVKVTYGYTTTLESTINAVTPQWLRAKNDKGGIKFKSSTGGPISLNLVAPTTVISGGRTFFQIVVSNTGEGEVSGDLTVDVSGANCRNNGGIKLLKGRSWAVYCSLETGSVTDHQTYSVTASTSYTYTIERVGTVTILKNPVGGRIIPLP